eukprot:c17397_g1_i1.p1 GENE.c17397_g1_i1~~c17397_g1_i1.p1  ORF type:complete len:464 (+),score=148.95 c17397_g1_i1:47-1438(+)
MLLLLLFILCFFILIIIFCCKKIQTKTLSGYEILSISPARSVLNESSASFSSSKTTLKLIEIINNQILNEREIAIQVCAYLKGKEVINIVGGVMAVKRHSHNWLSFIQSSSSISWIPITNQTLFMSYSVCKGVSATTLLTLVDKGKVKYENPVSHYWPEFINSKTLSKSAIEQKSLITVQDAISHRGGLITEPSLLYILKYVFIKKNWKLFWKFGLSFVEKMESKWKSGTKAEYHKVVWSWIIGGIVEKVTGNEFSNVTQINIVEPLNKNNEMFIGRLPKEQLKRVCKLEIAKEMPIRCGIVSWFIGRIEQIFITKLGNSVIWSELCLPSSNGYFTASSLAKMYGALANGGFVENCQLISLKTVNELFYRVKYEKVVKSSDGEFARVTSGFIPWSCPELYGKNAEICVGHSGMGGCTAFCDPITGLSICVLKSAYEPISILHSSTSPDVVEICNVIRDGLLSS